MRIIKLLGVAFFVTLAFSTAGALAAEPAHLLFLTQSGLTLLFNAVSLFWTLRGSQGGLPAAISCELDLIHGFVLHRSPLIHLLRIIFHGHCVQKINGGANESCTEPIETKPILLELGLINLADGKKHIGILLRPSEGTEIGTVTCGGHSTTIGGVVVGEIPETARGESQIGHDILYLLIIYRSHNQTAEQEYTSIELLGTEMTGQELKIEGFLGGKASWEDEIHIHFDGLVLICIK
jgi:hypothetical protein